MPITEEQRKLRKYGIGSSDAACIMGADPWKSEYELWMYKTGRAEQPEAGQAAEIGNHLESYVLGLVESELGLPVIENNGDVAQTFESGPLRANCDGIVGTTWEKGLPIVEIKTTGRTDEWGVPGTDEIPFRVLCQVVHQMLCADSTICYVGCLKAERGFKFDLYKVDLDNHEEFATALWEKCNAWWKTHVENDVPPSVERAISDDVWSGVKRAQGKSTIVSADVVQQYIDARDKKKSAEEELQHAKSILLASMEDAEVGTCAGFSVKYPLISRSSVDTKAMFEDHPNLKQEYAKVSSYRRLDVRKKS